MDFYRAKVKVDGYSIMDHYSFVHQIVTFIIRVECSLVSFHFFCV